MNCIQCNIKPLNKNAKKFCSTLCQNEYQRLRLIESWLNGDHDGMRGKTSTSNWIKTYLIGQRGEICGWCEKNIFTGNIPIELEHIDGDYTNNKIENLKLLCPNHHSLTSTYKGANKKGRPRSQYKSRKNMEV